MTATTFETIKNILVERFAINPSIVQPKTDLQNELNLDSMDAIDLLLAINETFNIRIPEQSLENIHTLDELIVCVERMLKRDPRA